jgi:hypothetical protein
MAKELRLSPAETGQARFLVNQFESHSWTQASSGTNGDWSFTLNLEGVRRFRGIRSGSEYLLARAGTRSFAHRLDEEARRPQFTLVGYNVAASPFGSGPICLRVENEGPPDEFEATVIAVLGAENTRPPWYVRWRGSQERRQEILTGHYWVLELCEAAVTASTDGADGDSTPGWCFLRPDGEFLVVPDGYDPNEALPSATMRVTVKVTPRSQPKHALENTTTLVLNNRGGGAGWDWHRVPPPELGATP